MESKNYRYPTPIQNRKTNIKLSLFLFLIISGFGLLTYDSANHNDPVGYYYWLIAITFVVYGIIFFLGDHPDVKVDDNGLYIEFLWTYLPVPWGDIIEIKHFRFLFLEWWLITTKNHLTFFHRLYSIYSLKSFLPGFLIHNKESQEQTDLLNLIRKRAGSRSKASRNP